MRTRFERDVANVLGPMSAAADNLGKAETNIHALGAIRVVQRTGDVAKSQTWTVQQAEDV